MAKIPEGVNVTVEGHTVTVRGPNGEVQRSFSKRASIAVEGAEVTVSAKDKGLAGTVESLLSSMMKGVTEGYKKNLKVLYAHFPVSMEVKGKDILIKNFLGEKQPRKTKIQGNSKVEVKGQNVTVSGPSKEDVSQTAASLKAILKIRDKDGRVFQDGIYEVEEGA
jgi:large subunit ribosomal protein L6